MKALVLLGGDRSPHGLLRGEMASADIVITADGGAAHLDALGLLPDIVVGDMDSVDPSLLDRLERYGVEIVRVSTDKDETDGWLAVDQAISRGASEIVILGAFGGRVDHLLGNLMLLVRAAKRGVPAVIKGEGSAVYAVTGDVEIRGKVGDTVSILPIGEGVSVRYLDGLKYGTVEPLPLPVDAPVGMSNEMTAEIVRIIADGWVYIIRMEV